MEIECPIPLLKPLAKQRSQSINFIREALPLMINKYSKTNTILFNYDLCEHDPFINPVLDLSLRRSPLSPQSKGPLFQTFRVKMRPIDITRNNSKMALRWQ